MRLNDDGKTVAAADCLVPGIGEIIGGSQREERIDVLEGRIKELGRQVSNYDESRWNGMRQILVYEGLLAKFEQNEDLKAQLKSTGDAILAECAVKDHIWGIGLSMKDPDRLDVKKWHGTNLLGYALMIVRERV